MKRLRSVQRMIKVQEDLRRMEEIRLIALRQRAESLDLAENQILDSMTKDDPRESALAAMAGDRLRWLDRDRKENNAAKAECENLLRERTLRKLMCEKTEKRLRQEASASAERRTGLDVMDAFHAWRTSFK